MGIQGLLPLLKSIMVPIHIKDLKGCSVAVDTYSWLHKGALSCSTDLCKGLPTTRHIEYCMHRVNLLIHYGVKPVMVFDGGPLPMKGEQENKRARSRKENLERAIEHESSGNSAAAYECYQKAVDISPQIAYELIQVLKQENVSYVVAPYEADAQMTFLSISKQVDAVITEDSDLIAFGCPRIIFKMDKFGQGVEFQYSRLHKNKDLNLMKFSNQMVLEMCILSGCDYLQSLPGMGLKRAHALIKKYGSYDRVIKHLKFNGISIPPLYEELFKKAVLTFQHQRVYDPQIEDIRNMTDISNAMGDDLDFLGPYPSSPVPISLTYCTFLPPHLAKGIAEGNLDPFTKEPFQGSNACGGVVLPETCQLKNYQPESEKKKLDLPVQKNLLTNYFCFTSLEAKRKFRAPRVGPKIPELPDRSSPMPKEHCVQDAAPCNRNSSATSFNDNVDLGNSPLSKDLVGNSAIKAHADCECTSNGKERIHHIALVITLLSCITLLYFMLLEGQNKMNFVKRETRSPENSLLFKSTQPLNKPCRALHADCDSKSLSKGGEIKTRLENGKVIVRSRYFQHNLAKEGLEDGNTEELYVTNEKDADCYFQQNLFKENLEDDIKENSLFRNDKYDCHFKQNDNGEKLLLKNKKQINQMHENLFSYAYTGISHHKSPTIKRKAAIDGSADDLQGNTKTRCMQADASLANQSTCSSTEDQDCNKLKTGEGKFGSDISHLSRYSDIAEKSMERFVSVISSFRCSTSGSRASGLRAPLKEVRNTCSPRPSNLRLNYRWLESVVMLAVPGVMQKIEEVQLPVLRLGKCLVL
ncbi:XPG-I domain [Dillenia turbinata]|uniref:Exonuclease 1 n=1 Tax=Dillenia turbinata TaxID=194707 RepID=A0AAN8UV03_9MAGN